MEGEKCDTSRAHSPHLKHRLTAREPNDADGRGMGGGVGGLEGTFSTSIKRSSRL